MLWPISLRISQYKLTITVETYHTVQTHGWSHEKVENFYFPPLDILIPLVNNILMTGQELKKWRRRMGLSQEELGRLLGVARFSVSRWEIGTRSIPTFLPLALEALENRMAKGGRDGQDSQKD